MRSGATINGFGRNNATVSDILTALSMQKRVEILAALTLKSMSVTEVARILNYDVSDTSKHLRVLRQCGLVQHLRINKCHIQSIASSTKIQLKGRSVYIEATATKCGRVTMEDLLDNCTLDCLEPLQAPGPPGPPRPPGFRNKP